MQGFAFQFEDIDACGKQILDFVASICVIGRCMYSVYNLCAKTHAIKNPKATCN